MNTLETIQEVVANGSVKKLPSVAPQNPRLPRTNMLPRTKRYIEVLSELEIMGVPEEKLETLSRDEAYEMLRTLRGSDDEILSPTTATEEMDVNSAEKLLDVARLASSLRVADPEGTLKDTQTAKERILLHMNGKTCHQNVSELLQDVRENARQYREACESLRKLADEVNEFVKGNAMQMHSIASYLLREFPHFEAILANTTRVLSSGCCSLIVAGEVSAGKSSFLNILCDGAGFSLPVSEQETTSCVCEVKYGAEEKAIVYKNDSSSSETQDNQFEIALDSLAEYINFDNLDPDDRLPYHKVEIFTPSQLLKCGLVLVDTPGVASDRTSMTEFVENYLRDSAGLVYIIKDAVNIHKLNRLFKLEASVTNSYNQQDIEDLSGTQSRRSLFILNKWDIINDKQGMIDAVQKKLDSHWLTEANTQQSEVLPLAATVDLQHLRAGYLSDRLCKVIEALKDVVPHNMKLSLQTRYKWLQYVVLRIEHHAKRYLNHASAMEKGIESDTQRSATEQLDRILKTGEKCFHQLWAFIDSIDLSETVVKLHQYIQSKSVRAGICSWEEADCPGDADMQMNDLEEVAKQKVEDRIRNAIEKWEDEKHILAECKQPVALKIKECLKELEVDAASLTDALLSLRPAQVPVLPFSFRFILSKDGSVVGKKLTKLLVSRFKKYRKDYYFENKVVCMQEMSNDSLASLANEERLTTLVEEMVSFKEMHRSFVQQVHELIGQFQEEIDNLKKGDPARVLRAKYQPLNKQCKEIRSRLLAWELRHIFDGNQIQSVEIDINDEVPISGSSHAVILQGMRNGEQEVLVKKYRGTIESDLLFINKEYRALREMRCPDIARALGMMAVDYCGSRRLCLIMEPGVSSLALWLENHKNVAAYSEDVVVPYTLKFAHQIAKALAFLHEQKVVNRNISSGAIIITKDNADKTGLRCKLYDIGVPQQSAMSLSLNEKLSRYSAPEVVVSSTFQPSMDVFSFGQVLSDLWYGFIPKKDHTVASNDDLDSENASVISHDTAPCSVGGLRIPTVRQYSPDVCSREQTQPPQHYIQLIVACTDPFPKSRPTAETAKNRVYDIANSMDDGSVEL